MNSPNTPLRHLAVLAAAATLTLGIAACKPIEPGQDKDAAATADAKGGAKAIPGLETESKQASYAIGFQFGEGLKIAKDEIAMAAVRRGIDDAVAGKDMKLTPEQIDAAMQAVSKRVGDKMRAEAEAKAKKNLEEGTAFLAKNAKAAGVVTTASGLQYQVIAPGNGPKPTDADTIVVNYTGKLLDGTEFDSTAKAGQPATFQMSRPLIPGWTEAVKLMPKGSKYRVWIPAALGYGEAVPPDGPIPPNATLVFEIELVDIVK